MLWDHQFAYRGWARVSDGLHDFDGEHAGSAGDPVHNIRTDNRFEVSLAKAGPHSPARLASYPHMQSDWLRIGPEAIYWSPRLATDLWNVKAIYITENGAFSSDTIAADGHVYDSDRVMFLRNYLSQLQRAAADGVPLKGYLVWSLLDNLEWADGYGRRFGIVYVDFNTQQRTPKLSAAFSKDVIAANAVC